MFAADAYVDIEWIKIAMKHTNREWNARPFSFFFFFFNSFILLA